jgi:hypothetical protein
MKKHILSFLVATVATIGTTYAQSYGPDAFRFSQMNYGSTSRFKGMGGAQIGVGGDIGSIGANPAGLGLFTKSEFSITPEFNSVKNTSNFLGKNTDGDKSQINLNNASVVFFTPASKPKGSDLNKGLVSSVFGLSYYRNNDFLNNIDYNGSNSVNSIRDAFAEQANAGGITDNVAGNAYNSYLINHNTPSFPNFYSAEPYNSGSFDQNWSESRLGSTSEFSLAGALNFSNKFYIGATLSFVNVKYTSNAIYTESGKLNAYNEDNKTYSGVENYTLVYNRNQTTKGSGVNLKLGMIFRPVNEFKIGINFQTPTWMNIQDNTNDVVNSQLSNYSSNNNLNDYYFSYNLSTPLKASAGLSYIIAKTALISADIDYVDY